MFLIQITVITTIMTLYTHYGFVIIVVQKTYNYYNVTLSFDSYPAYNMCINFSIMGRYAYSYAYVRMHHDVYS